MDFSKCCPWCERTFGCKRTCDAHKSDKHSEELKASRLKYSDPDEGTFIRCISCNIFTLNEPHNIKKHEISALHKSRHLVSKRKRKSEASSTQQLLVSSSLSKPEATLKKRKGPADASYPSSVNAANLGKFMIERFFSNTTSLLHEFIYVSQVPSQT